jgi:hypothetical protein
MSTAPGTFEMNGNAVISGYIVGVEVRYSEATFTMKGGKISSFTVTTSDSGGGGGVFVSKGTFTMSGGEISGNTAVPYGGGVSVDFTSEFTMSGGTISGNTGPQWRRRVYQPAFF